MASSEDTIGPVQRLSRTDKIDAVGVLAAAFHDYPVMRYVLKDAGEEYETRLRALIGFFVESRLTREWPLIGIRQEGMLVAVAAGNSPEAKPRPKELQEVYDNVSSQIGREAIARLEAFERSGSAYEPPAPHYYLGMLGVRPGWQGKGLGRILTDHLHAMSASDPGSTGVCLTTENPDNVPLYQHLGYRVLGDTDVGDFHTWVMFRED